MWQDVLKGHICPVSQIASHMQVNPKSSKDHYLCPVQPMVTLEVNGAMTTEQVFATLCKNCILLLSELLSGLGFYSACMLVWQ